MNDADFEFRQNVMYKLGGIETALQTIIEHQKTQNGRMTHTEEAHEILRAQYTRTQTTLKIWTGIIATIASLAAAIFVTVISDMAKIAF